MTNLFDTKIEFLKGVGPQKAALLKKELKIFTYGDLIQHYPFRHEDRTQFTKIEDIRSDDTSVQVKGIIRTYELKGAARKQRLTAQFKDETGEIELIWFKGVQWVSKNITPGMEYIIVGKPTVFNNRISISHPELEQYSDKAGTEGYLQPVYSTTETLTRRFLHSKGIAKIQQALFRQVYREIRESLPPNIIEQYKFVSKQAAILWIHFPKNQAELNKARARLKFEELFYVQLKIIQEKGVQKNESVGQVFGPLDTLTDFYNNHLPFELTNAQKRVVKEVRADVISGKQMNRLLQGDVGSGKTIVAFIVMLMAIDSNAQACLIAPTGILAGQHFEGLSEFCDKLGVSIRILTGASTKKQRKVIHEELENGELNILVGTHALLEDVVQFKNLGLCVIDEQHRFGVAQRAKLWAKNRSVAPHILVMTATPIPRTLAMTLYGDLDVSVIDELPAGRKPIQTIHKTEAGRLRMIGFLREQLELGRQAYVVYPLIEESETLDLQNLMDGYEYICRRLPEYFVSIVHGKLKNAEKESEMKRFIEKKTQIMVATTVIEVGVNVPNATVMVIENSERFGLAQLHQLRGRVGRGGEQSYCMLMTGQKLSREGKLRVDTMVRTTNGFEIADVDLQIRGPGDLAGTQQSGTMDFLLADLAQDNAILQEARECAEEIITEDTQLLLPKHHVLRQHIDSLKTSTVNWGRIS